MERERKVMNEIDLINQVGKWADKNFGDKRGADLGIAEEIGEAIHCVLKRRQGIRGFEKDDFFFEKFSDCLADIMIYLADWSYMHGAFFNMNRNGLEVVTVDGIKPDERRIISHMLQTASALFNYDDVSIHDEVPIGERGVYNMLAQRICTATEYWAQYYNLDLPLIVSAIWTSKVSKRDWKKHPAAPVATLQ